MCHFRIKIGKKYKVKGGVYMFFKNKRKEMVSKEELNIELTKWQTIAENIENKKTASNQNYPMLFQKQVKNCSKKASKTLIEK